MKELSTYAQAIRERFMVDLAWASSSLEGNTYTYLDTEALILYGQATEGRSARETQMILNHRDAIKHLLDNVDAIEVTEREIKNIHALLVNELLPPAASGIIRQVEVGISGSAYRPLNDQLRLAEEFRFLVEKARQIKDPFEQSVFLLAFISYLQPFADGNKRTARLAANIPLLKNGLSPVSFIDFDRREYITGILAFYELGQPEVLVKVYADGYKTSAGRYKVDLNRVLSSTEQHFALRYRVEIRTLIKSIVQGAASTLIISPATVASEDQGRFMTMVKTRLNTLTPDNAVVYGLRPGEVVAWRKTSVIEILLALNDEDS